MSGMSNAQVALMAAVQSVNAGDVSFGIEAVKRDIRERREEYLRWLNEQDQNTTNHEVPTGVTTATLNRDAAQVVDERDPECVKAWPGCYTFGYDPACCRFPKSCSAGEIRVVPAGQEGDQATNHEIRRQS